MTGKGQMREERLGHWNFNTNKLPDNKRVYKDVVTVGNLRVSELNGKMLGFSCLFFCYI